MVIFEFIWLSFLKSTAQLFFLIVLHFIYLRGRSLHLVSSLGGGRKCPDSRDFSCISIVSAIERVPETQDCVPGSQGTSPEGQAFEVRLGDWRIRTAGTEALLLTAD